MNSFTVILSGGPTLVIKNATLGKIMEGSYLFHNAGGLVIAAFPIAAVKAIYDNSHV